MTSRSELRESTTMLGFVRISFVPMQKFISEQAISTHRSASHPNTSIGLYTPIARIGVHRFRHRLTHRLHVHQKATAPEDYDKGRKRSHHSDVIFEPAPGIAVKRCQNGREALKAARNSTITISRKPVSPKKAPQGFSLQSYQSV